MEYDILAYTYLVAPARNTGRKRFSSVWDALSRMYDMTTLDAGAWIDTAIDYVSH